MGSILKSTSNTRTIIPNSFRFIRSDVPCHITDSEIQWLKENNIRTIVDLRTEPERLQKPCPLIAHDGFNYHCMSVSGGNSVPSSVDEVSRSYIAMADAQMERIIYTIMNASSNVLYFCNAGKDRTGVVSAILLHKLGADRASIIQDYLKSADNLREMLDTYCKQFPHVDRDIITPHNRYIEEFLDWLTMQ